MNHTPFGYRIEKGKAIIDEKAAEQIKIVYQSYLSGDSLATAAKKAGIRSFHASIGRILRNVHYLGDEFYPAIIDIKIFAAAEVERINRATRLGRIWKSKAENAVIFPTTFRITEETQKFDDPFAQAEYAYNLIEREITENEC